MTQDEIKNGNILLAKFLGKTVYPEKIPTKRNKCGWKYSYKWTGRRCDYNLHELKYHSSWDWLHPAWEKFRDLKFDVKNEFLHSELRGQIGRAIAYSTIEEAFSKLVQGVQWYVSLEKTSVEK